jgi:hypothetical protein
MSRWATRVVVGLMGLAAIAQPRAAGANCGAEGCPLAPQGAETALARFGLDLSYQYVEASRPWDGNHEISPDEALAIEGGLGHVVEQMTLTRSYLLNARARLTNRLLLTGTLPYIDRIHRHALAHHVGYFIESEWHMQGLGDASVLANWAVLSSSQPSASSLVLQLGAKVPTGETKVDEVGGETPEPPARPGSGSTDALVGAQFGHAFTAPTLGGRVTSVPLSLAVTGRLNGRGTESYRMGNEWQANLAAGYGLTHNVQLLAQVNGSVHARDNVGTTDAEPHSTGSTALFASPGLSLAIVPGMSMFGYYQFRLYEHTNGPQLTAPYHLSLGLGYTLGR